MSHYFSPDNVDADFSAPEAKTDDDNHEKIFSTDTNIEADSETLFPG